MKPRLLLRMVVCLALAVSLSGCGIIDYFFLEPPEDTAQELYEAGKQAMQDQEYSDAAEYFTSLKDRYPFSPYTVPAELALGDAYFLNENYAEAAAAYKEFETLHPRHEDIPYVLYQIGVSDFRQFDSIDKPQHTATEALEYFYRLRESYPGSKYAETAAEYIVKCRRYLAEHEIYVADFYWQTEKYGSAWNRYQYVIANYSDLDDVAQYARHMSKLAYFEYQKDLAEEQRVREHGSWKQWFDWL